MSRPLASDSPPGADADSSTASSPETPSGSPEPASKEAPKRRRTRGRTSALKLAPRAALLAQMKKPGARQALKSALDDEGPKLILLAQAERSGEPGAKDAVVEGARAFAEVLAAAMRAAKMPRPEQSLEHLRNAQLEVLLARAIGRGALGYGAVADQLERMRRALAARDVTAKQLELGIVALDELLQRLALVAPRGGFSYPMENNRARDSLITFARSLHR